MPGRWGYVLGCALSVAAIGGCDQFEFLDDTPTRLYQHRCLTAELEVRSEEQCRGDALFSAPIPIEWDAVQRIVDEGEDGLRAGFRVGPAPDHNSAGLPGAEFLIHFELPARLGIEGARTAVAADGLREWVEENQPAPIESCASPLVPFSRAIPDMFGFTRTCSVEGLTIVELYALIDGQHAAFSASVIGGESGDIAVAEYAFEGINLVGG